MNVLETYFTKQNKIIKEDRDKTLIRLGIVSKEYSPDGLKSWKYDKVDYINGQQKYYREIPLDVTDDEYDAIIDISNKVEAIRKREEYERELERNKNQSATIRKLVPTLTNIKNACNDSAGIHTNSHKNRIAVAIRIMAWVETISLVIFGIMSAISSKDIAHIFLYILASAFLLLSQYAISAIIDYLAEITLIMRSGFMYSESKEHK